MGLTWKDSITTMLALIVFFVFFSLFNGIEIPFINSTRVAIVALGIMGIGMCAYSSNPTKPPTKSIWTINASIMGVAALAFIVLGLITANQIWVLLLGLTIIGLWITTTAHHIIGD